MKARAFATVSTLVALALVTATGCSSDKFDPHSSTKDGGGAAAGAAGSDGGVSGSGGGSGASGSGGSAGTAGTAGTGGTGGGGGTAGNPNGDPNGTACANGSTCKSGLCVDDVCCDTGCDKECEACNVTGSEGTCTPYGQGTDPDSECLGGSASGPCSGSCDGASACEYPTSSCGSPTCSGSTQTNPTCDGTGTCGSATVSCAPYVCGTSTCKTSCGGDADCVTGNWCNGTKCEAKKTNGQSCGGNNQCQSAHCVSGVCCNVSSCASPASCSTGTCLCGGAECASGQSCVYWYQDSDNDTYGNAASKKPACSGTKPAGYVSNSSDCYDGSANAKPGQTQYFIVDRGDGSFDYNCDQAASVQYPKIANTACGECKPPAPGGCVVGLCLGGFGCYGACPGSGPGLGFDTDVNCGQSSDLKKCADTTITPDCAPLKQSAGTTTQGCR
ncbi:MAG: hypothetical protein H6717_37535 [Polyangiaceae bacterium]|nr:hypothetical protein [Polyangiaceae bacterium]